MTVTMVDMRKTPEERAQDCMPMGCASEYPYGLSISLGKDEIEKLGIDLKDWELGDIFHLHAMAKVTSVSMNTSESGDNCRVELQLIMIGAESEDSENSEVDYSASKLRGKMYSEG